MGETIIWILVAAVGAIVIGFVLYKAIGIIKMSSEERHKLIVSYLVTLVNSAEGLIGAGHGKEKLEQVEKWFVEKAPLVYKIILKLLQKENLVDLIEEALKQIKDNFGK